MCSTQSAEQLKKAQLYDEPEKEEDEVYIATVTIFQCELCTFSDSNEDKVFDHIANFHKIPPERCSEFYGSVVEEV